VATNSTTLNNNSRIYQGRFSSATWSGQLLIYAMDTLGNVLPSPLWDTGQKINAQSSASADTRVILTSNASTRAGVDFQYANLSSGTGGQQDALNRDWLLTLDMCGPERVAYLRGQSVNEGTGNFNCVTAPNTSIQRFRSRPVSKLGDIINSNPVYVGAPVAGYSDLDHPGYAAFRSLFRTRMPAVYVGANDGMLHGIDVSVNSYTQLPTANAGNEILAYVPTPLYGNLSRLSVSTYGASTHKYYVDGSPMSADVCVSGCTSATAAVWKTVLVGGLGAGGRGFYALNVTNPADTAKDSANTPKFTAANAANVVMWEFTSADDADVGYTYNASPVRSGSSQAKQIVKFENGRWGVVVGNGYNSPGGKAVLYVLFISGPTGTGKTWQAGTDYVKLVADAQVAASNGLSTPVPYDADGNGLADTVYAGDLSGNMWKFNLSSANPSNWKVDLGSCTGTTTVTCTPLFASGANQPITMPPELSPYPFGGTMVLFGTGKYLESGDSTSTVGQSIYGVLDAPATPTAPATAPISGRSALIPNTIGSSPVTVNGKNYRPGVTAGCSGSACPSPFKGWYLDFPANVVSGVTGPAERVTGSPKLISGVLVFNTFIPSSTPCDFGGTGWLMALDYVSGAMMPFKVFDTNADGKFDGGDLSAAGVQVGAALGGSTVIANPSANGSNTGQAVSSLTSGDTASTSMNFSGPGGGGLNGLCKKPPCVPASSIKGRLSWREILQ
jgi:type IV pilus assembly protein PilY1